MKEAQFNLGVGPPTVMTLLNKHPRKEFMIATTQ